MKFLCSVDKQQSQRKKRKERWNVKKHKHRQTEFMLMVVSVSDYKCVLGWSEYTFLILFSVFLFNMWEFLFFAWKKYHKQFFFRETCRNLKNQFQFSYVIFSKKSFHFACTKNPRISNFHKNIIKLVLSKIQKCVDKRCYGMILTFREIDFLHAFTQKNFCSINQRLRFFFKTSFHV